MIKSSMLENGIRVITESMPFSRSLAIGILISAGPRDETAGQAGLAHLVEHALFHGTSCRSELEISRIIDTMGGRISAFTGRDYTCFSAVVMDDHITYILDLFSDLLLNSIFPEDRLEHEKQIILSELASGCDIPQERVLTLLKSSVWPDRALGRAIEGSEDTIRGFSRADIIYFLHSNYLPNRISIALAGNLQHEDIIAQIRDCFWRFFGNAERIIDPPGPFVTGRFFEETSSLQAYFALGFPAPEYTHADRYGIHLLNTILGGGLSSRLYRTLREQHGLVYDVHSEYHAYLDAGMIVISGSTLPDGLEKTLNLVINETTEFLSLRKPAEAEEIWQAQLYTVGQHHIDSEDPYTRMSRLLTQTYYCNRVIPTEEIVNCLKELTQTSLNEICERSFVSITDTLAIAVSGPSPPEGFTLP
jgi:predicted Zn-dependent peptidase